MTNNNTQKNRKNLIFGIITILLGIVSFFIINIIVESQQKNENFEYRRIFIEKHPYDNNPISINLNYLDELAEIDGNIHYNYNITNNQCSKCHYLTRALNSNYIKEEQWERVVSRMVLKEHSRITSTEAQKIVDFLNFFSMEKLNNPEKIITADNINFNELYNNDPIILSVLDYSKKYVSPDYGKMLYHNYCSTCHGDSGEGGSGLKLNETNMMGIFLRNNAKFYKETIKMGRRGTIMPGWGYEYLGIFNDVQIESIIEHIKFNWYRKKMGHTKPIEYQLYEVLQGANINEGKNIYNNVCSSCHYELSPNRIAPDIRNYSFIGFDSLGEPLTIDRGQLRYIIREGRPGTYMKPFGENKNGIIELDEIQIDSIINYLRSEPVIYK